MINLSPDILHRQAKKCRNDMVKFARDIISIPSFPMQEEKLVKRIIQEMKRVGFDTAFHDKMGNVIGVIGKGKKKIMIDAHIDTVGVGDPKAWKWDPFEGKYEKGIIYGRGATDQKLSMVPMVYAAKLIKDLNLQGDYTLWVVGSCQEEDCDGLSLLHVIEKEKMKPDYVVITEPTNLRVYRGHRGRMEMKVIIKGKSCHASAPERGDNAVWRMSYIIQEIMELNKRLKNDKFLGKGTITVTKIECQTPSLNAVPDECTIYLDRRLTAGETSSLAVSQVKNLSSMKKCKGAVEILYYKEKSWTGLWVGQDKYYPTWVIPENHKLTQSMVKAASLALGAKPVVDKWTFSTNGVATMGRLKIPTIGFGPGDEIYAHRVNEQMPVEHLLKATVCYAALPKILTE